MNYCEKCKRDLPEGEKCPVCTQKKGVFIEMEMPKRCFVCRMRMTCDTEDFCWAAKDFRSMSREEVLSAKKRPSWCPLQEVKE